MIKYELSQILHALGPIVIGTLTGAVCVVVGILTANYYWKSRIHRFSKAETIQIMEYQVNKIANLEAEIRGKNSVISELKGIIKISRLAALKIVGVVNNE